MAGKATVRSNRRWRLFQRRGTLHEYLVYLVEVRERLVLNLVGARPQDSNVP